MYQNHCYLRITLTGCITVFTVHFIKCFKKKIHNISENSGSYIKSSLGFSWVFFFPEYIHLPHYDEHQAW